MYCENIVYRCPIVSCRSTILKLKMKKIEPYDQFGQLFKNLKRRNEHVKFCGNSLDWQKCGKIFKTQQSLSAIKTLKIQRNTNAKFVKNVLRAASHEIFQNKRNMCDQCNKLFGRKDNMRQHKKKKTLKDICKYIFITAEIFIKTKFSKSKKIESNSKNCVFMTFSSLKYITVFLLSWKKLSQKEILADEVFSLKTFVPLDCQQDCQRD